MKFGAATLLISLALASVCGCRQQDVVLTFESSQQVSDLDDEQLQSDIIAQLEKYCGTPSHPRMLGDERMQRDHLLHGAAIYNKRCVQCHGVSGGGNGPAAGHLNPRPRDYRRGIFKFTSTPNGAKPRRADLIRTVRQGVTGTSMPSFRLLPQRELEAVIDYVLMLTHRGELEVQLAADAAIEEEVDPDLAADHAEAIVAAWQGAEQQTVRPRSVMPDITAETIAKGKELFLATAGAGDAAAAGAQEVGCVKCHGPDGRGKTQDNVGTDVWGFATNAADLTSGMLHGGQRPIDIYRRIYSGINGTPMPTFKNTLDPRPPEEIWYLVHYVLHVADQRRATLPGEPQRPAGDETNGATTTSGGEDSDGP